MSRDRSGFPTQIEAELLPAGKLLWQLAFTSLIAYVILFADFLSLFACLLFAVVLSSRLIGKSALKGARIEILNTQHRCIEREAILCTVSLNNCNRILPLFYPTVSFTEAGSRRQQQFRFPGIINPGKRGTFSVTSFLSKRGLHRLRLREMGTRFPFACYHAKAKVSVQSPTIVVWPAPLPISLDSLFERPPRFVYQSQGETAIASELSDSNRIRGYQPGDPKARINWKLSAKKDELTVIETKNEPQERYELHLDSSSLIWQSKLAFERMLGQLSTLVSEMRRRRLIQGITVNDRYFPLETSRHRNEFFDFLSLLKVEENRAIETLPARRNLLWVMPAENQCIQLLEQPASRLSFTPGR